MGNGTPAIPWTLYLLLGSSCNQLVAPGSKFEVVRSVTQGPRKSWRAAPFFDATSQLCTATGLPNYVVDLMDGLTA